MTNKEFLETVKKSLPDFLDDALAAATPDQLRKALEAKGVKPSSDQINKDIDSWAKSHQVKEEN